MPCTFRLRKDDIPKRGKEKSYACDTCGALIFAERKPRCREKMLAEVRARHASAMAETDHEGQPR
jgi:hypothetical protein